MGLLLMICLFWMVIICLVCLVSLLLWVMMIMVWFLWCSLLNSVLILVLDFEFSVLVGLFVSRICGWLISVCVIVMCCFCLFDNWLGLWFKWFVRLIWVKSFVVCWWWFLVFIFVYIKGRVILFRVLVYFNRLKFWNIKLIFWLWIVVSCWVFRLLIGCLFNW